MKIKDIFDTAWEFIKALWPVPAMLLGIFLVVFAVNYAVNSREISVPGRYTVSRVDGLLGHVEYTAYADGSCDIKAYPGIGHRFGRSLLYQDLDGDGRIDRIRVSGAEWELNRIVEILVREYDYPQRAEEFDRGDSLLSELKEKYL